MGDELLTEIVTTLRRKGCVPRKVGDEVWEARCPACHCAGHTLVVYPPMELKCIGGKLCSRRRVLEALGLRADQILERAELRNRSVLARPLPPLAKQLDRGATSSLRGREPARSSTHGGGAPTFADMRPMRLTRSDDPVRAVEGAHADREPGARAADQPLDQKAGRRATFAGPEAELETKGAPAQLNDEPDAGTVAVSFHHAQTTIRPPAPPQFDSAANSQPTEEAAGESGDASTCKSRGAGAGAARARSCGTALRRCGPFAASTTVTSRR